jgi:hypothetical protein
MSLTLKLDTPQARFFPAARRLSNATTTPERSVTPIWPVQQVEIEMISAKTGEARLTSARDAVTRHVIGPYLGDKEYAVALTGNHAPNQFLGAAVDRKVDVVDATSLGVTSKTASGRPPTDPAIPRTVSSGRWLPIPLSRELRSACERVVRLSRSLHRPRR